MHQGGAWSGRGKYTWPDGRVYEGEFSQSSFDGRGKVILLPLPSLGVFHCLSVSPPPPFLVVCSTAFPYMFSLPFRVASLSFLVVFTASSLSSQPFLVALTAYVPCCCTALLTSPPRCLHRPPFLVAFIDHRSLCAPLPFRVASLPFLVDLTTFPRCLHRRPFLVASTDHCSFLV